MAIGLMKGFSSLDLGVVGRLLEAFDQHPRADYDTLGNLIGLNRAKLEGYNSIMLCLGLHRKRVLTDFGRLLVENDPRFKDEGTLCALHYLLAANERHEVWHFAANRFMPGRKPFTRAQFNEALAEAGIGRQSLKQLEHDKALFLNAYTSESYPAMQSLGYLRAVGAGKSLTYNPGTVERVPAMVLGYALYHWRARTALASTISMAHLTTLDGQVGKVFLLGRDVLLTKLRELEARGGIVVNRVADLDNIAFHDLGDPLRLLVDYYAERSRR